jgi:hypothetical protein
MVEIPNMQTLSIYIANIHGVISRKQTPAAASLQELQMVL